MTVTETRKRIEEELIAAKESFGEASELVSYTTDALVNGDENALENMPYVFGSLSIAPEGAEEDDKLYLPLDAEINDNDTVDEAAFETSVKVFRERVASIRERVLASDDYNEAVKAVIADFDREMEEKYMAEMEKLNKIAKRNLIIAAVATAAAAVFAAVIILIQRLA